MTTTQIEDIHFALTRLHAMPESGLAPDDVAALLEEMRRFATDIVEPGRLEADRLGARFENGAVTCPPGFRAAYAAWIEGGWQGLAAAEAHGGQGLPFALWCALKEIMTTADMAFTLCPTLTAGAIELLERYATPEQAEKWLPELVSGRWNGTMCLTESQAGSDLAAVRTKAEPLGDGRYALTGQKIFITYGAHDLSANTLHLVLARLPDAPAGSRGISLFAATTLRPDGTPNALRCGGIERKLGIHASPTCIMLFEGAEAELIGEPHRGLPAMFAMMNNARLQVGIEGVAAGARALHLAEAYAAERVQSGQAIASHPDVARMLAEIRAVTLAGRFLALDAAVAADRAKLGDEAAEARLALLTPIVKAWCTDRGVQNASLGVQVHGGMGFVEDTGAAQVLRDSRIAPIYEGTNGIQALDLVTRKLPRDQGAVLRGLLAEARGADARLAPALDALEQATSWILSASAEEAAASATAYLEACGWVLGGALLARAARLDPCYAPIADFYRARLLPRAQAHCAEILGAAELLALLPHRAG
ncbi:acyl-CoA dehydrogenase family protein [Roseococcus pinisoli]|uniref:Acyl-CoA dehydrogenase family protein n=1 Tax=Roseococcus pinisoli TaxID=2835040 RepID=A0ABS5QA25_9PROT|nr:acyl-CoA dehydrogenase family protein [Roseococcus pinisoli]MBS7810071.1 acyl-CoA dehydrogenase family protein [Roseococcus pinisoli]